MVERSILIDIETLIQKYRKSEESTILSKVYNICGLNLISFLHFERRVPCWHTVVLEGYEVLGGSVWLVKLILSDVLP